MREREAERQTEAETETETRIEIRGATRRSKLSSSCYLLHAALAEALGACCCVSSTTWGRSCLTRRTLAQVIEPKNPALLCSFDGTSRSLLGLSFHYELGALGRRYILSIV